MKHKYIVVAVLAALVLAAGVYLYGGSETPSGQPPLRNVTVQNVAEIKSEFNAAKNEVRVVLLLSPT